MKNYLKRNKYTWIVLAPLVGGWLFNFLMFQLPFSGILIWTVNLGFILFWFWAGRQFSQLTTRKVYGFLFGNSLWLLSFLLYIWQFVLLDETSRNMMLAGLSQYYMLFMIIIGTQIHMAYSTVISSTEIVIISYMLMFVVFSVGFMYQGIKGKTPSKLG